MAGHCKKRNTILSTTEFAICSRTGVEVADRIIAFRKAARESRPEKRVQRAITGSVIRSREKVGTALKARIENLITIKTSKGCGCQNLATQMDGWGIAGCEQRRDEIMQHLVGNRSILADALKSTGFLGHAVGLAIEFIPDMMLRSGAATLLDAAIEDVRKQVKIPQRIHRSLARRPFISHPLAGVPIDRARLQSHILYHVMPLSGDTEWVWRRHCNWLREARHKFNGRLIIGIVTPGKDDAWEYCHPDSVRDALAGLDAEFIEAPNDTGTGKNRKHARRGKGEGVLFPQMMSKLKTSDPDHVAFYGHCKAVTRPQEPLEGAIHRWAEAMFETLFRNHDAVVSALDTHGVCGSFRMPGGYRDGGPGIGSNWFYSGTFFATRLADAFARRWDYLPTHYGCVEQWPRLNFDRDTQSACLFFDNVHNLYDEQYWKTTITPAFEQWKREHGTPRTE